MSDLNLYRTSVSNSRIASRQAGRLLAHIDERTSIQVARIEAQADIQAAKVDAVLQTTQRAMQGTALVSQLEQQLCQLVPIAASRLQAVGDLATLAMGQVVADTVARLRRP